MNSRELWLATLDLYKPYLQSEDAVTHVVIRSSIDRSTLFERLRTVVHAINPHALVDAIRPMTRDVDRQLAPWRFAALLFSLLAALGLMIAIVGLYALVAARLAIACGAVSSAFFSVVPCCSVA